MNEKGRWQRAVNLRYLTIFCIVEMLFLTLLYIAWQYNRNSYLANRSSHLKTVAEAIGSRSEAVAHAITHEIIQQPNILNLLEKAGNATKLQRQVIRRELHDRLVNTYQRIQQETPLRIQLVLPDGTSLLRMHKPEHWGDQLFPVREVLRLTASEKREITGYESGRNDFGAYRFAFPLFSHDRFIGIAELSLDDQDLVEQLGRQYKHSYWMVLARSDIALPKQFNKERQQIQQESAINPDYLEVLPESPKHGDTKTAALIKKLQNNTAILKSTSQNLLFSTVLGAINNTPIVSTFIPINNAKNQHEAYLVVLGQAPILKQFDRNFYIVTLVGTLLIIGLTLLARHLSINRRVIREERETLKAITDAMGEGLLVQDSQGQLLYQNPKSRELLGYHDDQLAAGSVHALIHQHGEGEQGQCPILHNTLSGKNYHNPDEFFRTKTSSMLPVEVIATPLIRSGENVGSVTLFRDIRHQKEAEQQILRLNKLYSALSATNHAIVQISHREELFNEICSIAVIHADFKAAFIGILSEDGKSLTPVAAAGVNVQITQDAITILHHGHIRM
jgi:PAS domain S-box-containing protein